METLRVLLVLLIGAALILRRYSVWKAHRAESLYPPPGQFVTIEGVWLHYVRKGVGRPVVLLHGSDGFLQDFLLTLFDRLAAEFDVVALDRPGHGYSDAPRHERATPQVQARLLHAALHELGIRKPVLVGHSWSGSLLMAYALEYPDEVSGLTLLGGWVYPSDRLSPLLFLPQIPLLGSLVSATLLAVVKPLLVRQNLRQAFFPAPIPPDYERLANALWQRWPRQTRIFAEENTTGKAALHSLSLRYAQIQCPVVIVAGECDRVVDITRHAQRLHQQISHSELISLPETGHEVHFTQPDAVVEAIRRCWTLAEKSPLSQSTTSAPNDFPYHISTNRDYRQAHELVFRYGWNATAYQILNPNMTYWFTPDREAVIGYVRRAHTRVVAGAPVCDVNRLDEIVRAFEADASQAGEHVCYFGAAGRLHALLSPSPTHAVLPIGAQPVWNPEHWSAILAKNASLRAQLNRARNKGVQVQEWATEDAHNQADLQRCLEEWLATRPLPTLHFLTEPVTLDRLTDRRLFVATREDVPVGFLVATPVPDRQGWLIEQIVRGHAAPNGTAELLVDDVMRALHNDGFHYVTLGLAPLSQRASVPSSPLPWVRLLMGWARAHGRRFYNFDGLDAFKAKFKPDTWEPLYAISNEPLFSLRTLLALASAFIDGKLVWAVARAMLAALRQELVWLQARSHHTRTKTVERR